MIILAVVGARPNFMKAAPIIAAINEHSERVSANGAGRGERSAQTIRHILVHTGQHYDEFMSGSFFGDLNLPKPAIHLGVGSGSHAVQTAEIMKKFEEVLLTEKPDVVVVVGDVNSTLACALVAAKISFDSAGSKPVITPDKIHFVGNTMIDSLLTFKEKAETSIILDKLGLRANAANNGGGMSISRYALLTLHRPSNVDNRSAFLNILDGLEELAADWPIVFPIHPRTRRR